MNFNLGKIAYADDYQYREIICKIFNIADAEEFYSSEVIDSNLDKVYADTINYPFFKNIYEIAAGFMLSTDARIGVCILFAYDYTEKFYNCLSTFMALADEDKNAFSETTNAAAKAIYVKLQR